MINRAERLRFCKGGSRNLEK